MQFRCPRCGFINNPGSQFCNNCGLQFTSLENPHQQSKSLPWWVIIAIVIAILVGISELISFVSSPVLKLQPAAKPSSTGQSQQTQPILNYLGEWSGDTNKTTEAFTVKAPWLIEWQFTANKFSSFTLWAKTNSKSFGNHLVVNGTNTTSADSSYIHESGTYYLEISSYGGNWNIKVYGNK